MPPGFCLAPPLPPPFKVLDTPLPAAPKLLEQFMFGNWDASPIVYIHFY